jgi:hypothetical protein
MFATIFSNKTHEVKDFPVLNADSLGLEVIEEDPETAWQKWEEAISERDFFIAAHRNSEIDGNSASLFNKSATDGATDNAKWRQKNWALVAKHHPRVAKTIETLWGTPENTAYLHRLLLEGGDGMGSARIGFSHDVGRALLALSEMQEAQFHTPDMLSELDLVL